jgi:hypothetical protein
VFGRSRSNSIAMALAAAHNEEGSLAELPDIYISEQ